MTGPLMRIIWQKDLSFKTVSDPVPPMTEAGAKLSPAAAGKTVQMSDEWVEKVLDNLVPTSPAAIAIEKSLRNGTLVKGVAAIDKNSGKLIILRVQ